MTIRSSLVYTNFGLKSSIPPSVVRSWLNKVKTTAKWICFIIEALGVTLRSVFQAWQNISSNLVVGNAVVNACWMFPFTVSNEVNQIMLSLNLWKSSVSLSLPAKRINRMWSVVYDVMHNPNIWQWNSDCCQLKMCSFQSYHWLPYWVTILLAKFWSDQQWLFGRPP